MKLFPVAAFGGQRLSLSQGRIEVACTGTTIQERYRCPNMGCTTPKASATAAHVRYQRGIV